MLPGPAANDTPLRVQSRLAKEKALSKRVLRIEREDVLARAVGASFDIGDHRRDARDFGFAHHAGTELRRAQAESDVRCF